MSTQLCEMCRDKGMNTCALIAYRDRVLATARAVQRDLAATPGPQGGNEGLIEIMQADTDTDLASLPDEAALRGCTLFIA